MSRLIRNFLSFKIVNYSHGNMKKTSFKPRNISFQLVLYQGSYLRMPVIPCGGALRAAH